jgi:MFS family permease
LGGLEAVSRIVQGAGGGTVGVIQAYVADAVPPEQRAKALVFGAPGRLVTKGAFLEAELAPRQLDDVVRLGLPHALAKWRTWLYDDGMGAPLVGHLNGAVAQPWDVAEQKFGGCANGAGQRWQRERVATRANGMAASSM